MMTEVVVDAVPSVGNACLLLLPSSSSSLSLSSSASLLESLSYILSILFVVFVIVVIPHHADTDADPAADAD